MTQAVSESIEEYLQQAYRDEKLELERVQQILGQVWQVFIASHTPDNGWGYRLREGEIDKDPGRFSASTNAMILFAIGLGLGYVRNGALATTLPRQLYGDNVPQRSRVFFDGMRQLIRNARSGSPTFESGSFGFNDPLTLSWVLDLLANRKEFLNSVDAPSLDAFQEKVVAAAVMTVDRAFSSPSTSCLNWATQDKYALDHAFPLLRAIHVYHDLLQLPGVGAEKLEKFVKLANDNVRPFLLGRLHLHLSLSSITNSDFDAAELVFALEGLLLIDPQCRSLERSLVARCFEVMEETQKRSPYWRPLKPFVTTLTGMALLPLSVEIANSLLRICKSIEAEDNEDRLFTQHYSLFNRYSAWLFTRIARLPEASGEYLIGWHSEHVHAPRRIHPWETAQVVIFFLIYSEMLQDHVARTCLTKANFSIKSLKRDKSLDKRIPAEYWQLHCETKEPLLGLKQESPYRVFGQIRKKYLETRSEPGIAGEIPSYCSMVLCGPPGTGKTTIAEDLAKTLKWRLVTITPSDFMARGAGEVEARAKAIFRTLEEQRNLVILFDEIDQLILDRDCRLYREQGDIFKFMTPSMLVKIRDLRKAKRSIFIVATNYEERIDPAIKRIGRIDEMFIVCPPDKLQRRTILVDLLKENLAKRILDKTERERHLAQVDTHDFVELVRSTVFATYGELEDLVKDAVADLSRTSSSNQIGESLSAALGRRGPPAINLQNYKARFDLDGKSDSGTVQRPFEELLLLFYLKIENDTLLNIDCQLINKCLETAMDGVKGTSYEALIKENLVDESICQVVTEAIK